MSSGEVLLLLRDRVRFERTRLGYTQNKFAEHCGIPLRTYKRFELGGCDSVDVFIRVIQGFGRGPGLDTIFPPQALKPRGLQAAMWSIRSKLDEGVVKGKRD